MPEWDIINDDNVLDHSLVSTSIMRKFITIYKKSVEFAFGLLLIILALSLCFKLFLDYI